MNTRTTPTSKMTGFMMRGGINIDEDMMAQFPDSEFYWGGGAKWAKVEIFRMFDGLGADSKIEKLLDHFYHSKNTWMRICLRTEHCLDLLKAVRTKTQGQ